MLQASQFNNVLGTNRRKMPRRLCRLKSRTWETTTSASWRNPTAPPPSSRSSPSGCSTPSTWTESRPPAARLQVPDHYGSGSATQSKFSPARKQKNMWIEKKKKKNTTWTVDSCLGLLQTSAKHGLADVPVDLWTRHHKQWLYGGKEPVWESVTATSWRHALPSFKCSSLCPCDGLLVFLHGKCQRCWNSPEGKRVQALWLTSWQRSIRRL